MIQRDRHAFYVATLAVIASTLDKIATEVRHLQRTEVREAEEYFSEKQKGSSAMPHKRNPVTCEQISGLARVVRANSQAALENVALWHERDISHSSVERVILPDSTILADYLLAQDDEPDRYPAGLSQAHDEEPGVDRRAGLQRTVTARSGGSRGAARRCVSAGAVQCDEGVEGRPELPRPGHQRSRDYVEGEAQRLWSRHSILQRPLRNVDKIFKRVFG